jgi:hypothetical protein
MAKVKAKVVCFVDNHYRNEGDVFQYNGPFNGNLEYLDVPEQRTEEDQHARKVRKPRNTVTEASE